MSRWQRWAASALALVLVGIGCAIIGYTVISYVYGKDLPNIEWAVDYRPPIISNLESGDDQLLAEFSVERRHVIPYRKIPKRLVQAFIAAEDADFFEHPGFDWKGIIRSAFIDLVHGKKLSGASTITQQTAKAILITNWGYQRATQKTFKRKIYELLLARRLEERFTKEQILYLYLNQVYLGHNAYGVQAAAENYFRKNVGDLTLGEMALLAGLPQSPSGFSPFMHPERAKKRRRYVLEQMLKHGMITKAERDQAAQEKVHAYPIEDVFHETAPYVAEHVRRDVVDRYGNDRLLTDGLRIYTTVDLDLERAAQAATLKGLSEADQRQGFRGPLLHLTATKGTTLAQRIAEVRRLERKKGAAPGDARKLEPDEQYVAAVLKVDRSGAEVGVGDAIDGTIPVGLMSWARKPDSQVSVAYIEPVSDARKVLSVGDLVLVRTATEAERKALRKPKGNVFALEQEPQLEGALVSMDPKDGYIIAMIGGYDFDKSQYNRAFQSCFQPGSSFKPLYYSAALGGQIRVDGDPRCHVKGMAEADRLKCWADTCQDRYGSWKGGYWDAGRRECFLTPSTVLFSSNIVSYDQTNGIIWKPENYDPSEFGDFPLRQALVQSMNLPSIKIMQGLGPQHAADWIHKLGITTPIANDDSIALGSSCVRLWDMVQAYALFNQMGKRVHATFIRRVEDRDGRTLEDHSSFYDPWTRLSTRIAAGYAKLFENREQVIDPATAYLTTNLMREVCLYGTAARAAELGRPLAGKTGTTNDSFDAWFMGFSPEIVAGVWVGYDDHKTEGPMDKYETGGHTALPIWMDYMRTALNGRPIHNFAAPAGVTWAPIDPKTGLLDPGGHFMEAYRSGTEPTPQAAATKTSPPPSSFFRGASF